MPQIWYTVEFDRILPLNSVRDYMIYYLKEIQGLLSNLTKKTAVFQGFQGLEKSDEFQVLSSTSRTCTDPESEAMSRRCKAILVRLNTVKVNKCQPNFRAGVL